MRDLVRQQHQIVSELRPPTRPQSQRLHFPSEQGRRTILSGCSKSILRRSSSTPRSTSWTRQPQAAARPPWGSNTRGVRCRLCTDVAVRARTRVAGKCATTCCTFEDGDSGAYFGSQVQTAGVSPTVSGWPSRFHVTLGPPECAARDVRVGAPPAGASGFSFSRSVGQ